MKNKFIKRTCCVAFVAFTIQGPINTNKFSVA